MLMQPGHEFSPYKQKILKKVKLRKMKIAKTVKFPVTTYTQYLQNKPKALVYPASKQLNMSPASISNASKVTSNLKRSQCHKSSHEFYIIYRLCFNYFT